MHALSLCDRNRISIGIANIDRVPESLPQTERRVGTEHDPCLFAARDGGLEIGDVERHIWIPVVALRWSHRASRPPPVFGREAGCVQAEGERAVAIEDPSARIGAA